MRREETNRPRASTSVRNTSDQLQDITDKTIAIQSGIIETYELMETLRAAGETKSLEQARQVAAIKIARHEGAMNQLEQARKDAAAKITSQAKELTEREVSLSVAQQELVQTKNELAELKLRHAEAVADLAAKQAIIDDLNKQREHPEHDSGEHEQRQRRIKRLDAELTRLEETTSAQKDLSLQLKRWHEENSAKAEVLRERIRDK